MINEQTIPCPVCNGKISFVVQELLQGGRFTCPTCNAVVSISPESIQETQEVMKQYEQLKKTMGKRK